MHRMKKYNPGLPFTDSPCQYGIFIQLFGSLLLRYLQINIIITVNLNHTPC